MRWDWGSFLAVLSLLILVSLGFASNPIENTMFTADPAVLVYNDSLFDKEENSIEWLAVSDHLKRQGIGRILVEYAINELDSKRDMKVQTFSKGVEAGTPARNLYQAFGFEDHKNMGKNPAGIETVLMIKKQKNVLI